MTNLKLTVAFAAAMVLIVVSSNVLVQYPLSDWLTWGAIIYPFSFLVVDLANRYHGPRVARRIVYVGFVVALVLSAWLATPRIAVASGTAFLCAELLDVTIFNRLRRHAWWKPPLVSTLFASVVDTAIFFTLAFAGTDMPWVTLALGDLGVKVAIALFALVPFRVALALVRPRPDAAG
ncbi:MAG: queuosine precursor transporter [Pseudomonadota bacterium]